MNRNCLLKNKVYRTIIFFVFVSAILCGCHKEAGKDNNKQLSGADTQSDIDTTNEMDTLVKEESESADEDITSSQFENVLGNALPFLGTNVGGIQAQHVLDGDMIVGAQHRQLPARIRPRYAAASEKAPPACGREPSPPCGTCPDPAQAFRAGSRVPA